MLRLRDLLQADPNNINGAGIPTELFFRALDYAQKYIRKNKKERKHIDDLKEYYISTLFMFDETKEGYDYWQAVFEGNIVFVDGNWKVVGFEYPWDEMNKEEPEQQLSDSIVDSVVQKFQERSEVGIKKYNNTLDRNDLCLVEWLNHLQEELMDATLYIQKLKEEV